jgi:hypothetical protein
MTALKKSYTIQTKARDYHIVSDEPEKIVSASVTLVNETIRKVQDGQAVNTSEQLFIIALLRLASESVTEQQQYLSLVEKIEKELLLV